MKSLVLTTGEVTTVDDDVFDELSGQAWFGKESQSSGKVYAARNVREGKKVKTVRLHRLVMNCFDPQFVVHHKDGNPLNNVRENLEVMELSEHTAMHNIF